MFRTILSYLILILVPAVSLAIAIVPYIWARKKSESQKVIKPESQNQEDLRLEHEYRPGNAVSNELHPVPLAHLWGAFFIGLVGNVVWWMIVFNTPSNVSYYIHGVDFASMMFGFIAYGLFVSCLPYVFHRIRFGKVGTKHKVYYIILALIIILLEIGVGIVLFVVGWGLAVNSFLNRGGISESSPLIIQKLR